MIGIYKITNPLGEVYIGQSRNIKNRFATHKYFFNKNGSKWGKLYSSFEKYGINNHVFEIIAECIASELHSLELVYQNKYNSIENGLNSVLNKGIKGKNQYSINARKNMSNSAIGKVLSNDTIERMKSIRQGKDNPNSKIILDIANGIYYETLKELAILINMQPTRLSMILNNRITNTTNYKFV